MGILPSMTPDGTQESLGFPKCLPGRCHSALQLFSWVVQHSYYVETTLHYSFSISFRSISCFLNLHDIILTVHTIASIGYRFNMPLADAYDRAGGVVTLPSIERRRNKNLKGIFNVDRGL
jgi:hypothetical protein